MLRPLRLPKGSVRALLLLALASRALLELRATHTLPRWLAATLVICAAAYFSARASTPHASGAEAGRARPPLGLPRGTVRTLFLLALGYGVWFWLQDRQIEAANVPVAWILLAFLLGVLARAVLGWVRRPDDVATWKWHHLQALVCLLAAAGLVSIAAAGHGEEVAGWVQPMLAAGIAYYFGAR
jgi:hypothetical protein